MRGTVIGCQTVCKRWHPRVTRKAVNMEGSLLHSRTRALAIAIAGLLSLTAPAASAQSSTDYLLRAPYGSITVRGGYSRANTSSQPYEVMRRQTTVGARSFDAPAIGLDLAFYLTRRFDLAFSFEGSAVERVAEYREWEENGQPIRHTTHLDRFGLGASLRYNLVDRGRSIGSFAWIPARYVPYVGGGAGVIHYELSQAGDFVEETDGETAAIFTDHLETANWGGAYHGFAGIEYRIRPRWSLTGEGRYTHSDAHLGGDYVGLGRINLSGTTLNFGATFRF